MTEEHDREWQNRLLPLMSRMVVGLALFFLIVTFAQLAFLHWNQQNTPESTQQQAVSLLDMDQNADPALRIAATKLKAQILLEYDAIGRHFRLLNVALMARLWIKYLGFVTGMIISLIGASFILGKLKEDTSNLEASNSSFSLSLKSASPGLFLVVIGSTLMLSTIFVNHRITQNYKPLYANKNHAASTSQRSAAAIRPGTQTSPEIGPLLLAPGANDGAAYPPSYPSDWRERDVLPADPPRAVSKPNTGAPDPTEENTR